MLCFGMVFGLRKRSPEETNLGELTPAPTTKTARASDAVDMNDSECPKVKSLNHSLIICFFHSLRMS